MRYLYKNMNNSRIYKTAQDYENKNRLLSSAGKAMSKYTAILRGLVIIYHHAHWTAQHESFYGDHLLFDKLYKETTSHMDDAAEKTVGVFGAEHLSMENHIKTAHEFVSDIFRKKSSDPAQICLLAEETFLEFSKQLYDMLKENKTMTLGVDDMIMATASDHERHVYLLKQRVA